MQTLAVSGLYKITNIINERYYIGSSININKRWGEHQRRASYGAKEPLYCAIRKYGVENFKLEILETCDVNQLIEQEQKYLNDIKDDELKYNLSGNAFTPFRDKTVVSKLNRKHSDQTKKRQSEAAYKRYNSAGKEYPSLINDITGQVIPAGRNFRKMCRENGLKRGGMWPVVIGTQKSCHGWRINNE